MCQATEQSKTDPNRPTEEPQPQPQPLSEPQPKNDLSSNDDNDSSNAVTTSIHKNGAQTATTASNLPIKSRRRSKRDKEGTYVLAPQPKQTPTPATAKTPTSATQTTRKKKKKKQSKALQRHKNDNPSGGIESFLPSLIGLAVLVLVIMAQRGFRGRASVAGIDLGTTNSVVCVQAPSKSVGTIDCIVDPSSGSAIIPSVVSFLKPNERKVGPSSKISSKLHPHPSHVVVGQNAKQRIDSHPHHTFYHAKRVLGRTFRDPAVAGLQQEVEFSIVENNDQEVGFPYKEDDNDAPIVVSPQQVGSYVVFHLIQITKAFLGHDNVQSAVICVPAKFNTLQRQRTMEAFKDAGISVARVIEEPAAAALAYGLHKKPNVEKILVYDFGGGTLDVSILHVSDGFVDIMGSDGDDVLGGADFDAAVAASLATQHDSVLKRLELYEQAHSREQPTQGQDKDEFAEQLSATCSDQITDEIPLCTLTSFHTIGERLKISLSELLSSEETTTNPTVRSSCWALPEKIPTITTKEAVRSLCDDLMLEELKLSLEGFEIAVKPLLDRSALPITRLLDELTLDKTEIDEIVMVGGTTRMPQIRQLVRLVFGGMAKMNTSIDPDLTVAYGAASVID